MEELLKPSVNSVPAFVGEELKELRSRDQSVLVDRPEKLNVSFLERQRRTVGALGTSEARKTTTERSQSMSGVGNRLVGLVRRTHRRRNGFEGGFGSGFGRGLGFGMRSVAIVGCRASRHGA